MTRPLSLNLCQPGAAWNNHHGRLQRCELHRNLISLHLGTAKRLGRQCSSINKRFNGSHMCNVLQRLGGLAKGRSLLLPARAPPAPTAAASAKAGPEPERTVPPELSCAHRPPLDRGCEWPCVNLCQSGH